MNGDVERYHRKEMSKGGDCDFVGIEKGTEWKPRALRLVDMGTSGVR